MIALALAALTPSGGDGVPGGHSPGGAPRGTPSGEPSGEPNGGPGGAPEKTSEGAGAGVPPASCPLCAARQALAAGGSLPLVLADALTAAADLLREVAGDPRPAPAGTRDGRRAAAPHGHGTMEGDAVPPRAPHVPDGGRGAGVQHIVITD